MANPMTATEFVNQLKKWKIPFREDFNDWATHNRGSRGNGFANVHGVIQHHTGADNTTPSFLYHGDSSLPGPLCHVGNDKDGVLHLIGWGRANHAGGGDRDVLNHVIAEDYGNRFFSPDCGEGDSNAYDGNGVFYGIENMYSGTHPMTHNQLNTAIRFSAAVCDFHHWTGLSVIGHGEWSNQKHDPSIDGKHMINMVEFRQEVNDVLKAKPTVPNPPVKSVHPFPGTLKPGMTSSHVTELDRRLIEIGYGRYYKVGPGPYFGTGTANAVRAFLQKHPSLWTDGHPDSIVGPKTWAAIFNG